jgi:hypothetical protein
MRQSWRICIDGAETAGTQRLMKAYILCSGGVRHLATSLGPLRASGILRAIVTSREGSYSYVALLKFVGPVWPVLRFHVLHEVDQRRGEGSGARPFPGGELEDEKGVGIQLD